MAKYRKIPVVIEAVRLPETGLIYEPWFWEAVRGGVISTGVHSFVDIETLEGVMRASPGDYIIRGVNGEIYPCKADIFEKTYEKVEQEGR